jgi:hypothetical protein
MTKNNKKYLRRYVASRFWFKVHHDFGNEYEFSYPMLYIRAAETIKKLYMEIKNG